jgi:hypothetical protein
MLCGLRYTLAQLIHRLFRLYEAGAVLKATLPKVVYATFESESRVPHNDDCVDARLSCGDRQEDVNESHPEDRDHEDGAEDDKVKHEESGKRAQNLKCCQMRQKLSFCSTFPKVRYK